jgi:hypothetical protein
MKKTTKEAIYLFAIAALLAIAFITSLVLNYIKVLIIKLFWD